MFKEFKNKIKMDEQLGSFGRNMENQVYEGQWNQVLKKFSMNKRSISAFIYLDIFQYLKLFTLLYIVRIQMLPCLAYFRGEK